MNRHEGVSCDSCLNSNFRGKRWKCLVCFDYDLCSICHEEGATSLQHTTQHPMQCILTRAELELYYSGELSNNDQPQSLTCPYCGKFGFTESGLLNHVNGLHANANHEVVCPICALLPYGLPNVVTDNFAEHLAVEHRSPIRELASILDETSPRHTIRNVTTLDSPGVIIRPRRSNINLSQTSEFAPLTQSRRDIGSIAELLSQLSGDRRSQGSASQYMDLPLQLQRHQVRGQPLVRVSRRAQQHTTTPASGSGNVTTKTSTKYPDSNSPMLLLTGLKDNRFDESNLSKLEENRANIALFVGDLIIGCLQKPFDTFENISYLLPVTGNANAPQVKPHSNELDVSEEVIDLRAVS